MTTLTIHHNIYLNREERYALHVGQDVATVGVSVPVWIFDDYTSEPAREVFCRYYIKNPRIDMPIVILENGYEIHLPYCESVNSKLMMPDDEWRELNLKNPELLDKMYRSLSPGVSSKNLLDVKDGGSEFMSYREHNKVRHNEEIISIMHYVVITTVERLEETIV